MLQEQAHGYRLPLRGFGAIAIGHVIILEPGFLELHGPWLLAHELSHTRQHDWLGPAYLPVHAILQAMSVVPASLQPHKTTRDLRKELKHLGSAQALPDDEITRRADTVDLKDRLCDV